MYEVALSVAACVRSGTRADVAWIIADEGFPLRNKGEALVVTPGGGKIGRLLDGALDDQILALVAEGASGRIADVTVTEVDAMIAGLPSAGRARCLIAAADSFPDGLWDELWAGKAACLVTRLDGDRITGIQAYTDEDVLAGAGEAAAQFYRRGSTDSLVEPDRVVTALWPVPRLAIVGGGPIVEAIETAARPLGWQVVRFGGAEEAKGLIMGFGALDMVLVASHDLDIAGATLTAALAGQAGYIGALGTVEMNEARQNWLISRGVGGHDRIHGPAGLDIGAKRPGEVAIAILAEALAARSGRDARPLREGLFG